MKYIFIGDIHGKVEEVERALSLEGVKIFVGDFMDSFDRPSFDHAKCLDLVLSAVKAREARAIYGNHELSYMRPWHRCSGYSERGRQVIRERWDDIETWFESHILLAPTFLVTHAGLTKQIWEEHNITLETLDSKLVEWWGQSDSPAHAIGRFRGGSSRVGGIFWCDWNQEFEPIPGLTQVFGHTAGKGIRQIEQSFCIDCLDRESRFLELTL